MKVYNFTCQGESHKVIDKICQDSSDTFLSDDLAIAVVCDGHGGERYFRSDIGSKLCTQITIEKCKQFVEIADTSLFLEKPFTACKALKDNENTLSKTDEAIRQLLSSIIATWRESIKVHADNNPITEEEKAKVEAKYLEQFNNNESIEKNYGCTLIACVRAKAYWFAFQIGDGKCIALHNSENMVWNEPIPWDDNCFLNRTTSICDSSSLDEFRYCYQGDGAFPTAVFLGSDGLDDSFGEIENLADFYIEIAKALANDEEQAYKSIEETLPELSKIRSKDDMSCAIVYDIQKLKEGVPYYIEYQINSLESIKSSLAQKLNEAQTNMQKTLEAHIEYQMAKKEIERLTTQIEALDAKIESRKKVLNNK